MLKSLDEVNALAAEWNGLVASFAHNRHYLGYDWFISSYKAFGTNEGLHVLIVEDKNNHIVGVAPFSVAKIKYRGISLKRIGFLPNNQNPGNDVLVARECEKQIMDMMTEYLLSFNSWSLVDLQMLDSDSHFVAHIKKYLSDKGSLWGVKGNRCSPCFELDCDWDTFWAQKTTKFKKVMRNKINRAAKENVTIERSTISNSEDPRLQDMFRISSKSWKKNIGTDFSSKPKEWEFYCSIFDNAKLKENITLWLLKLDNTAIAYELHLHCEGSTHPLRADYDEEYKFLSPGSLLEYEIIKSFFQDSSIHEYHSCGHTYDYLLNWSKNTKNYINIEVFKNKLPQKLVFLFEYSLLVHLRKMSYYAKVKKIIFNKNG